MKPGGTAARGYGAAHKAERAWWAPVVAAGQAWCSATVCLYPSRWIPPGSAWHLGHNQARTAWLGPMHVKCNIADANVKMKATFKRKAIMRRAVWSRW